MLTQLSISNYTLIEKQSISWLPSFSVITGETGAGKSILLGALSLVMGDRAELSLLRDKTKKCIIEAVFSLSAYEIQFFFSQNELDYEENTTVRREISPEGKSRAFINDTPVTLSVLKEFTSLLLDIHSQHETLLLTKSSFRFDFLDTFSNALNERNSYRKKFHHLKKIQSELQDLLLKSSQFKKDTDYFSFQLNEIELLSLKPGDLKKLEEESERMENVEAIKSLLEQSSNLLTEEEENSISKLNQVKNSFNTLSKYGENYKEIASRVASTVIELNDISAEIQSMKDELEINPKQLQEVNQKLDAINRLLRKHGFKTEDELLNLKNELQDKLDSIGNVDTNIKNLQGQVKKETAELKELAVQLSQKRMRGIPELQKQVSLLLQEVKLPNSQFKIELKPEVEFETFGCDKLSFLFTANKGNEPTELHKVASGGELSRLMLCLKAIMAQHTKLPTLIFDEIDTGVSGDVAHRIGTILHGMGQKLQVISITHSAQVAAEGVNHLLVYKEEHGKNTRSTVKWLTQSERINEIAKMISTGEPTPVSLQNAKELLKLK